jgi:hypothetical protein
MSQAHTTGLRRELAYRSSGGIEVFLLWSPHDDNLAVTVLDSAGPSFELAVAPHEALDVFDHPFAHAAHRGCLELIDVAA